MVDDLGACPLELGRGRRREQGARKPFLRNLKKLASCTCIGGKQQRKERVFKLFLLHNIWPALPSRMLDRRGAPPYAKVGEPPTPGAVYLGGCSKRKRQEFLVRFLQSSQELRWNPPANTLLLPSVSWILGPPQKMVWECRVFGDDKFRSFTGFLEGKGSQPPNTVTLLKNPLKSAFAALIVHPIFLKNEDVRENFLLSLKKTATRKLGSLSFSLKC